MTYNQRTWLYGGLAILIGVIVSITAAALAGKSPDTDKSSYNYKPIVEATSITSTAIRSSPTSSPTPIVRATTQKPIVRATTQKPPQGSGPCTAYLYAGTNQNLCDRFPGSADVDCSQVQRQVVLPDYRNDPWALDGRAGEAYTGQRGVGCEEY